MASHSRSEPTLLTAALAYAARGVPIFPCNPRDKSPLTAHGFEDASVDPQVVGAWWLRWPHAMIGVPTGERLGSWVLDVDDPALFEASCEITLPATRRCSTGKGYHLYFAWNDDWPVRNAQKGRSGWPFSNLPGCDVRGEGGYVIVPPSVHPEGRLYQWARDEPSSEAPQELLDIVCLRESNNDDYREPEEPITALLDSAYGLGALSSACDAIRSAENGAQEGCLSWESKQIGELVGGGELRFDSARKALLDAGDAMISHDQRNPWTPQYIRSKVVAKLRQGMKQPRRAPPSDGRPEISIEAGALHETATKGEQALIDAGAPLYVRGGIVRPVVDTVLAAKGRETKIARLVAVTEHMMVDHLSRSARFTRFDARSKKSVSTNPPPRVATIILSRDGEWKLPPLAGVITTPTLRPDGTILSAPGYDEDTQLLLMDPPELPPIPQTPAKADAESALRLLKDLLAGFPFVDEASRSVALSMLITPVVRGAMRVAPMHAASAPTAGTGKSYLVDLVSAILTGDRAPVIAVGRDEAETEKRLQSALLTGQPLVCIDNVNGTLGGDFLCQAVERPRVEIRPLGLSKLVRIENRATIFATGNNIQLIDDMTRRVILCSLDANQERPELRQFAFDPFERVVFDRGAYIAAVLTLVRAYIVAGFPQQRLPLASFEGWSNLVRSALVWLGEADPIITMERARADDPVTSSRRSVFGAWYASLGSAAFVVAQLKDVAETKDHCNDSAYVHPELHQALIDVAAGKGPGIDSLRLGKFLSSHNNGIVDGLKLVKEWDAHRSQNSWRIIQL